MIEQAPAHHQGIWKVVRFLPAINLLRMQSHGRRELHQPIIAVELTAIVDEDLEPRRVVDQEPAIEKVVEDSGSLGMLSLDLTKLGQEIDRPVRWDRASPSRDPGLVPGRLPPEVPRPER